MITLEITTTDGTRQVTIDPDAIPLAFFEDIEEAQTNRRFAPVIRSYGALFGLTDAERREMTIGQFKRLAAALTEGLSVPLASG